MKTIMLILIVLLIITNGCSTYQSKEDQIIDSILKDMGYETTNTQSKAVNIYN